MFDGAARDLKQYGAGERPGAGPRIPYKIWRSRHPRIRRCAVSTGNDPPGIVAAGAGVDRLRGYGACCADRPRSSRAHTARSLWIVTYAIYWTTVK
jgi:hypothetical protein